MGFSLGSLNPFKSGSVFEQAVQGVSGGLAEVDKTVNRVLPGGWTLPALVAAAVATGYFDPSILATEAGTAGAGTAGTAAGTAGAGTAATTGEILGSTGFVPAAGSGASFTVPAASTTLISTEVGKQAFFTALSNGFSSADAVNAGLAAQTAAGGAGGVVAETVINPATGLPWEATGSGLAGNGVQLTPAEFATQAGTSGTSVADALRTANSVKNVLNTLSNSGQSSSPQALAGALQAMQTPMEQFGGLYRMNEKPFLQQQTASISPDSYNVSGQNIASPIAPTNQLLANLLYSKA